MSIYEPEFKTLSFGPSYSVTGSYFIAKTCFSKKLLSFFSYERRLLMDKQSKMIRLSVKKWWFNHEVIELPFSRVRGILYNFKDHGTSWSVTPFWMGRTDSVEFFSISLVLKDPRSTLALFSFAGEGSASTGLRGVILGGDDIVDIRGSQENDSLEFLKNISKFLGVGVVPF